MATPDRDFDVIVVGFGAAGACAAIAAAEHGARVLVVDRALGGGASAVSGGVVYAGGGTPYQVAAGYDDDADNMFAYLRQEVQGVVDDATLRRFCEHSANQLAWLEAHGAKFESSLCPYKTSYPTKHYLYFSGTRRRTRTSCTPDPPRVVIGRSPPGRNRDGIYGGVSAIPRCASVLRSCREPWWMSW